MPTRAPSTRRTPSRRPVRKAKAPTRPGRTGLGRIAAAPLDWVRRPVRVALTATLVGYGLAEAIWQGRARASR